MLLRACLTALLAAPLLAADDPPKPAANPAVTINLLARHGHATPERVGFTHTGGGNIDVQQPAPDTVVVTMTGVAVAGAHPCKASRAAMDFDCARTSTSHSKSRI